MRRHRWAVAAGLHVVLSAAILARFWTLSASPIWDAFNYFYPAFAFLSDALREGGLPLWDPYTNCGLPYHADPQAATLNPIALLLGAAVPRPALGFVLFWVAHWIVAGLGMLVVVRALRGTPAGGLAAALAYAFSGFFVGHAQHTSWIVTAAWLPLAVGLAHLAVASGRMGFALLAGAAMAMSSLGGYPPLVGVGLYFVALWLAAAFLGPWSRFEGERPSRRRTARRILATLAIVTVVLVAVWSPVLHAFLFEAREYTHRTAPITGVRALFHPFTLRAAISLLFPYAIVPARPWIAADLAMNDAYVGLLALPLAAVAFTTRRPGRRLGWLLAIVALMGVVSAGEDGPLARALAALVPPMKYNRHAAGYRLFWILPLAAASGVGASLVLASARARARLRAGFAVTAAVALLAGAGLLVALRALQVELPPLVLVRLFAPAAVVLPAGAVLLWRSRSRRGRAWLPVGLVALLAVDLAAHVHLSSGTVAVRRKWILEAERLPREPDPAAPRQAGDPREISFNVQQLTRAPIARGYVTMKHPGFNGVLALSRHLEVLVAHRYWLAPATALAGDEAAMVTTLAGSGARDPVPVFVDRPEAALPGSPVVPGTFGAVRIASYRPERVKLEVELPGPAVLASTERYAPGWRVTVDGATAPTLRVNAFFRGVLLPAGRHVVIWKYRPARWRALVALSAVALAGSIAGGVVLLRRRRGRAGRRAAGSAPAPR